MEKTAKQKLEEAIKLALRKIFPKGDFGEVLLETPKQEGFGDYSCAIPLKISKKERGDPRKIAEDIIKELKIPDGFSAPEIKGPGFINFSFTREFLADFLVKTDLEPAFGKVTFGKGKTVVTDTSHPNVAKPMGVHHILSTIIGNALNRMFAHAGYKVVRDNYLGDWGTQFGKLIYAYKTWGDPEQVKKNPVPSLLSLYVKFHDKSEKDKALDDSARAEFRKLEQGDEENRKLWKWAVGESLKEFQKLYKRLDVSFDVIHGESFYEDKMSDIISFGVKKGVFTEGEEGALIARFEGEKYPPAVIRKKDGATLYITRDLARTKYWEQEWHPDIMLITADSAQKLHFEQLFETVKMLGLTKAKNVQVVFGRMRFPEKKMSTRKGNILPLEDLLDEAISRARKIVESKNPTLSSKEKEEIAEKVGIGAVKYTILSQNRETDTVFTWEKMLSLDGDSGPYLQYAHARARSILRKAGNHIAHGVIVTLEEPQEVSILRMFPKFPEIIEASVSEYRPNILAHYLADLASKFNTFYAVLPVLQAEDERIRNTRLKLVYAVAHILKTGLSLLGIEAPERM